MSRGLGCAVRETRSLRTKRAAPFPISHFTRDASRRPLALFSRRHRRTKHDRTTSERRARLRSERPARLELTRRRHRTTEACCDANAARIDERRGGAERRRRAARSARPATAGNDASHNDGDAAAAGRRQSGDGLQSAQRAPQSASVLQATEAHHAAIQ